VSDRHYTYKGEGRGVLRVRNVYCAEVSQVVPTRPSGKGTDSKVKVWEIKKVRKQRKRTVGSMRHRTAGEHLV
jgi:hypothetical protein